MRGFNGYGFSAVPGAFAAGGFPWIAVISWIIGIALIATIIYFAVKTTRPRLVKNDSALDTLAGRFARGEISKDEYQEAKDILRNS